MTPFPQLQAFLAVARSRSFSVAARELGVSRSAVSQNARQLEEELSITLVARTPQRVPYRCGTPRIKLTTFFNTHLGQAAVACMMTTEQSGGQHDEHTR